MSQAPSDAANTLQIPDFLIRAAVAGRLHPVVVQYLALNAGLAAMPAQELAAQLDPWFKVSQALLAEARKSAELGDPILVATLAAFIGVERAEDFQRFARTLQRKVPDLESHLRLLATFRSFADAAAKDRAERHAEVRPAAPSHERVAASPPRPLAAPPATPPAIPPMASNNNQHMPSKSPGAALPRRSATAKLWPGHTYVVRRRSAGSE